MLFAGLGALALLLLVIALVSARAVPWYWAKRTVADSVQADDLDAQISSLLEGVGIETEVEEVRKGHSAVGAAVSFARPRLSSAFVVGTSAAVTTLVTAFIFVGSPPTGSKSKSEPMTRQNGGEAKGSTARNRALREQPSPDVGGKVEDGELRRAG